jgi:hypothetical protein
VFTTETGVLHDGAGLIDHDDDHRPGVGRLRSDRRRDESKERNEKKRRTNWRGG